MMTDKWLLDSSLLVQATFWFYETFQTKLDTSATYNCGYKLHVWNAVIFAVLLNTDHGSI